MLPDGLVCIPRHSAVATSLSRRSESSRTCSKNVRGLRKLTEPVTTGTDVARGLLKAFRIFPPAHWARRSLPRATWETHCSQESCRVASLVATTLAFLVLSYDTTSRQGPSSDENRMQSMLPKTFVLARAALWGETCWRDRCSSLHRQTAFTALVAIPSAFGRYLHI